MMACRLKHGCNVNTYSPIYYCVVGMHNKAETYYWVGDCDFMTAACHLPLQHFSTAQQTPPNVANAIYLDCTSSWSTNQHSDWYYTFNHSFLKARLHGSPRLINTIESMKLNSTVEWFCLHGSTKVNEAVDFKMAANELVREGVVAICDYLINFIWFLVPHLRELNRNI